MPPRDGLWRLRCTTMQGPTGCLRQACTLALVAAAASHEYMHVPPGRTGSCLLNGLIMGGSICQTLTKGDDQQCLDDPLMVSHLFHVHPAYDNNACGGSTQVVGLRGGSQGILQECGDIETHPADFNMSLAGATPIFPAGEELTLQVKGFFHQGVMRMALCYTDDSDCSAPEDFSKYILGYHFTEGTASNASSPLGIYDVVLPFKVRMPRRAGHAVLQWLVAAEDVRAYVSCSTIELTGANHAPAVGGVPPTAEWTCNGHPLCNCTTHDAPVAGSVGLGMTCPQGTAASVINGSSTGTDIVKQYKDQVGVQAFCDLCITNGCPSTCGGIYNGYYQGPKCTNTPTIPGCDLSHATKLPRFMDCTEQTCMASGWAPSPQPAPPPTPSPSPSPPAPPPPPPTPGPPGHKTYCAGNTCSSGWVPALKPCPANRPMVSCWNSDNHYKCCAAK